MSGRSLLRKTGFLLVPPEAIASPETRLQYLIDRLIGEGSFGQAYPAIGSSRPPWDMTNPTKKLR